VKARIYRLVFSVVTIVAAIEALGAGRKFH
jgi:hypothetical protein